MPLKIRPPIANQLLEFVKEQQETQSDGERSTNDSGNPLINKDVSLTINPRGPTLIQDYDLVDEIAHFNRERIPERVVHAKGAGAFGYFEVTDDITAYTAAKVFSEVGKITNIVVRFSQVTNEMGSQDTVRDPRGFAIKFYTEDGIWDLVGNNTPIFFVQDAILFPSFIHCLKRNPVTHVRDWDMFWDFFSLRPETTHQALVLYSDRGIPDGYRRMHGYGSNTFAFVNSSGQFYYCKFHYKTNQGIQNLDADRAAQIAGRDPDYALRDLYNAIANKNFPSWTFYIQIMTQEQARFSPFNPFDVTKVWPHGDYPLIRVGKIVLNRNPSNYFAEIEQLCFNPANLIPGIEPSPDKNLQGRLFAYGDAGRYRLGANYTQLPVNRPSEFKNFNRDGFATIDSQGGAPNYHPNSFGGPEVEARAALLSPILQIPNSSHIQRQDDGFEDNYSQARVLYQRVLDDGAKTRLINNIANDLQNASNFIQELMVANITQVDSDFGRRLTQALHDLQRPKLTL